MTGNAFVEAKFVAVVSLVTFVTIASVASDTPMKKEKRKPGFGLKKRTRTEPKSKAASGMRPVTKDREITEEVYA